VTNRIAIVYFSATGVTRTYAGVMRDKLLQSDCAVEMLDVTALQSRSLPLPIANVDCFIFGFPVYADFAPSVINTWLPTLSGEGKCCTQFLTYGGRTTGYAHFHTKLLLEGVGFQVLLSGEFLGRHSFNYAGWTICPDRPHQGDLHVAREYAVLALDLFSQANPPLLKLQKPFGYWCSVERLGEERHGQERRWPQPCRSAQDCQMCLRCEEECPTGAFNAQTGQSNPDQCIECMHCVAICPDYVIEVSQHRVISNQKFLDYCHLDDDMLDAKQSRIIRHSWQAAA